MKASVYIATTLDGFIARENGDLDWLPGSDVGSELQDAGDDFGYSKFIDSVDALIMGRNIYEMVLSSEQWPYGSKRVIVLSFTLKTKTDNTPDTVEFKSVTPIELYSELEESGATHFYIGGGKTIQQFIDAGLINEIIITKVPVLIGSGIPLFGSLTNDKNMRHIETQSYKNGFVQSTYEVIN